MTSEQIQASIDLINAQIAALAAQQIVQQKQAAQQLLALQASLASQTAKLAALNAPASPAPTQG